MTKTRHNHSLGVPEDVWEWAQGKTGQTRPAGYLRDILTKAMYDDVAPKIAPMDSMAVASDHRDYRSRWAALGLTHPDPMDSYFDRSMKWLRSCYQTELEALQACERKSQNGYDNEPMEPGGIRKYICWLYGQYLKESE